MHESSLTNDKLIELESPSNPQISPNARYIVYTLQKVDWKENAYVNQIFLVENSENAIPRQLTFSKLGSFAPVWSPDSQILAFLSRRNGDQGIQIYRLPIDGGEAERLTDVKTDIQKFRWSPDGKTIAFTAVPPESSKEKMRWEKYGDYHEDNVDYNRSHLWLLNPETKKLRQLTTGDALHVRDFQWHPDGQLLAIDCSPSPDMGQLLESQIYLLDVQSLQRHPVSPKHCSSPCWSPNGEFLVYERRPYSSREGAFYKNGFLEIYNLATETSYRLPMVFDEDPYPIGWGSEGIYFWAIQRTSIQLFSVSLSDACVRQISPDYLDGFCAMQYSFSQDFSHCGLVYADSDRFWEVASINLLNSEFRCLTNYDQQTRKWDVPRHELYRWKSSDGTEIEGVLSKPLDFDPQKQYPLLVIIHGGPTWVSLRTRFGGSYERRLYPMYQWLEKGAIILQPNYRGSAGYGETFRGLNVRDLGTGDYADVISGVDSLIAEGWIDGERVAAMGWSQGGYISAFITAYSQRFKAVSVGAGISNWMTYYVNTDVHPFTLNYLQATPWDEPEIYAKTSPMSYIKNAKTPTLIQHGEKDFRVPLPNAFELHQGLLDQGLESKLVVYSGMPHGPNKPKQSRHIMDDNWNWFNRHIFGTVPEAESSALYIVIPNSDETKTLFSDAENLAMRDAAQFRVLASDGSLVAEAPTEELSYSLNDISAIVNCLTQELQELAVRKIRVYSDKAEDKNAVLVALGCIEIAAGLIGGISVESYQGEIEI
jgi:dipeptidyl aminopeptidase/acylaminoacyl peptidase